MDRSELARKAVAIAHKLALKSFCGMGDFEDRVADAGSIAWEMAQTAGPDATPGTVAWFAVKRAASERRFPESVRSVDHLRHSDQRDSTVDVSSVTSVGDDPYEVVMAKLDTEAWLDSLKPRQRFIAVLFWRGLRTGEIAILLRMHAGDVSRCRKLLRKRWLEFQEV